MPAVRVSSLTETSLHLDETDLHYFCKALESRAGIALKPSKQNLVQTRLRSRIATHGFKNYKEYRQYLETLPDDHPEWESFTNSLTTNKTEFFREPKHFDFLAHQILPQWLKTHQKTFKVWSAASSTGEEAYTLAMVLDRHLPKDRDFKILATDVDTKVLKTAQNGVYHISKKMEIPEEYHSTCLDIGKGNVRGWFRIKPHLKEKVIFKKHNLIEKTFPGENVFDLVLCRNVLIYFGPESVDFVQRKLYYTVKPGGYLFIGHSESFNGLKHQWSSVGPSILKKAE